VFCPPKYLEYRGQDTNFTFVLFGSFRESL
jgi:hypothetical protein